MGFTNMSQNLLHDIVNHVFLPPRLPCKQDSDLWIQKLSELLLTSLHDFKTYQDERSVELVSRAIFAVQNFQAFRDIAGGIEEQGLGKAISQLKVEGKHICTVSLSVHER